MLPQVELTVVVNVGDDTEIHGLHVSADIDTVTYTLARVEGPEGWGRAGDTFVFNEELARFGLDNRFRLGDLDLALNLYRTNRLRSGAPLSTVTRDVAGAFGIDATLIPATDDRLATEVRVDEGGWITFQEYFVIRANQDEVREVRFNGSGSARPAPGVVESIEEAEHVVIGPSNPPLSIWPILAVQEIEEAVARHPRVTVVSPLIGGRALKGPADRVMGSLGLPAGNAGVVEAYDSLVDEIVIHLDDADDASLLDVAQVTVADTLIEDPDRARALATRLVGR